MLCVCTKRVCVYYNELVCKAVRLAFSCQTSAISLPFILIPCLYMTTFRLKRSIVYRHTNSFTIWINPYSGTRDDLGAPLVSFDLQNDPLEVKLADTDLSVHIF